MYNVNLINEIYPEVHIYTNKKYINACKIILPTIMITFLSTWIGYIVGGIHCNNCIGSN